MIHNYSMYIKTLRSSQQILKKKKLRKVEYLRAEVNSTILVTIYSHQNYIRD